MEINTLSAILSALYPGIGQLKNLHITKGLFLILFFTMVLLMAFYPGSQLNIVGYVLIPMVWIWNVVDASQLFMIRPGTAVPPSKMQQTLIGVVIGWFVIELAFVLIMLLWPHNRNGSAESGTQSRTDAPQSIVLPKDLTSLPMFPGREMTESPPTTKRDGVTPPGSSVEVEETGESEAREQSPESPDEAAPSDGVSNELPPPSRPSATMPDLGTFAVSLGNFVGPLQANELRDRVVSAGFDAVVLRVRLSNGVSFIVLVPGYDTQLEATKTRDSLRRHNQFKDCFIVRNSKLKFVE